MKKAIIIVAHPDDETLWSGGLILQNPSWDWTVLALCRASDPDRAPKFKKVCSYLNAKPIICDLDDEVDRPLQSKKVQQTILENLKSKSFNYIFTHGANGEYGHIRHLDTRKAVIALVKEKKLNCEELWHFAYVPSNRRALHDKNLSIPIADKMADWQIQLTEKQHKEKLKIITELYGFKHPIFETMAAGKQEAFSTQHIKRLLA